MPWMSNKWHSGESDPTDDDLFKRLHDTGSFVHIVQSRDLHQPSHVVRVKFVGDDPLGQFVPFIRRLSVNADPPFTVLFPK